VNLFQDFISQRANIAFGSEVNISAVKTHQECQGGNAKRQVLQPTGVCKTYPCSEEWTLKCKEQGHKTGDQSKKKVNAKTQIKSGKGLLGRQARH